MGTNRAPVAFVGHGSPMNALEENRYTAAWRALGSAVGRPRAVLVVSAHWYINATAVTAMARPRTIHDFYGFPPELFAVEYPAPGDAELAGEIVEAAAPEWVGLDADSWGLDHGTWSVLRHLFPRADVPVVQLSINAFQPLEYHLDLAARLAPLRDRGVMILGSGNVVHNLRLVRFEMGERGFDWADRFDEAVREVVTERPGDLIGLRGSADYSLAVPTPDHFIPLLYLSALAAESGEAPAVLLDGALAGSLTMTAFTLGLREDCHTEGSPGAADEAPAGPAGPVGH